MAINLKINQNTRGSKNTVISFKEVSTIFEARGIFNPEQQGKAIIKDGTLYSIIGTGYVDDWETFQKQHKCILANKTTLPKFFTQIESEKGQTLFLVGSRKVTKPSEFPGFSWPTKNNQASLNIKPQSFSGITDKWMTVSVFRSKLFSSIDSRDDLGSGVQIYLKSLFDHYYKNARIEEVESISGHSGAILKDFGEIIGVVWYLGQKGALAKGQVFLPSAGNYPLIDSIVKINGVETRISSKAGGGVSNTIKGADIIKIIDNMPSGMRKNVSRRYAHELDILDVINSNTAVVGSIKAFNIMEPRLYAKHKKEIDAMIKAKSIAKLIKSPIRQDLIDTLKSLVAVNTKADLHSKAGALYLMSKHVEKMSYNFAFAGLVEEVLADYVVYVHAKKIAKDGVIEFKYHKVGSGVKGAYLRFKGTVTRAADKLGLQLKL